MGFLCRIGFRAVVLGAVVSGAVGCGKDDPEVVDPVVEPVVEPETVIIGCAGVSGADVDVRTQLGDELPNRELSVYWEKGDEIRLWARETGTGEWLTDVRNKLFQFNYYSPSKSRAGFAGKFDKKVASTFAEEKKYDYYAVSPAPASDADVDDAADADGPHIKVTYTIPAEQEGDYDGQYDILTARLKDTLALKEGDDNPSVNLTFDHHVHLLKFTIASNKWEKDRPVRAVELTFPSKVVGQLTVDATGTEKDVLKPLTDEEGAGTKVLIKFPKGKERKEGETFYAMIAPTEIGSRGTIGMRIIGTLGETSAEIPAAGKSLAAGHTTPVELNVKAMTTRYKTVALTFNVVDNDRPEFLKEDGTRESNKLGENTLGERVNTVRVKGTSADTFSKAILEPSDLCKVEGSDLILTVPDDKSSSAEYSVFFLPKNENPDYLWPDELRDKDFTSISEKTLEVEYESARALIDTKKDAWAFAKAVIPRFQEGQINICTLSVPYLFCEDFSKFKSVSHFTKKEGLVTVIDHGAYMLDDNSDYTKGWSASYFGVSDKEFCMASYMASATYPDPDEGGNHRGRLTTAFLPLKSDVETTAIRVSYRVAGTRQEGGSGVSKGKYTYAVYELGLDTQKGAIKGDGVSMENPPKPISQSSQKGDFSYDGKSYTQKVNTIPGCTSKHRVSWRSSFVRDDRWSGSARTVYVYLDDIKVQLAPIEEKK